MEKNSLTFEEKELHRVTQKNTNFNSIKTNLLGTTCIEIGPIVGCTGGKSMEGSSKPLVSIGTFETRKEPLRIHKKISEDSAEDELNEKTVEKHRKFIQRNNGSTSTIGGKSFSSSSQVPSKVASMPSSSSNQSSSSNKELEIKQQSSSSSSSSSVTSTPKSILSTNKATSLSSSSSSTFNSSTATTMNNKMSVSSTKSSSSVSNKSAPTLSFDKGNGSSTNSTTTIEVNPEQTSSCDTTNNAMRSSKECIATVSSTETISSRGKSSINFGASTISSSSSSHVTTSSSSTSTATSTLNKWGSNNNPSSTPSNNDGSSSRNKPVLKRIQKQSHSESSSEQYTVNSAVVETITSQNSCSVGSVTNTASLNSRNNLITLTNGDKAKVNGSSGMNNGGAGTTSIIANKRTSFLRDIIVDSSSKSSTVGTTGGIQLDEPSGIPCTTAGVQVICKNNEEGSLIKTELKVDLKPSVNNGKLSHPPFGECLSNRSNGTSDSSEFDDSLEDSGLDIKKCSEISESDEKSGSGSDSGNENDYSDRDRVKIIPAAGPKSGLFISVEEVEGTTKKPEKLSPDSVLFSSASEMSASGSSESIPEALDTVSNGSSQKSSEEGSTGGHSTGAKRAAPRPPQVNSATEATRGSNAIYANTQTNVMQVEGIYDDVSFYKNPMHFPPKGDKISAFEEEDEEEENIYDDCTAITTIPKGGKQPGGKSGMGSYNFQNGSRNALDSDGEEEAEKVVHRRSDGIEFIGIRKIDSESFLRERSPTPERSPDGKRERSSSASPKTRRKVNQFFSTIGKKAGAAFSQHVHGYGKNKGSPTVEECVEKSPSGNSTTYKRSLSTDEVSMTRTQEIYATLTPTSLKFKGLGPVLHKLSKMDLHMGDKDKGYGDGDEDKGDSKEKGYKKHKISSSIKKFLRFGSKDGGEPSGHKYDFGNCQNKTEMNGPGPTISSPITEEQTDFSVSRTPTPTTAAALATNQPVKVPERKPSCGTLSGRPPPPPPPRVHSLDLLNRVGVVGPNGTVRPARPPPPARHNRVAPSFTSVFTNPNAEIETKPSVTPSNEGISSQNSPVNGNGHPHYNSTPNGDTPDPNNPPSKPKRKASMNLDCVTNGTTRQQDLETTYNHITTLNLETLKLIASQTPTKIRRSNTFNKRNSNYPLKWSQFDVPQSSKPLIQGHGFVFYSAFWDDESCVLLVQESATAPNFSAPFEFPCVETSATFEDFIPSYYITWQASEYVTNGSNVKGLYCNKRN
ncbi:unnamed protein product [Orchesella dallaii]|uniref:Uncharacterized protein n=1 Tax=Orchesella dallaii TaxID=48710 RepID=A0ABP1S262_9HEXA